MAIGKYPWKVPSLTGGYAQPGGGKGLSIESTKSRSSDNEGSKQAASRAEQSFPESLIVKVISIALRMSQSPWLSYHDWGGGFSHGLDRDDYVKS